MSAPDRNARLLRILSCPPTGGPLREDDRDHLSMSSQSARKCLIAMLHIGYGGNPPCQQRAMRGRLWRCRAVIPAGREFGSRRLIVVCKGSGGARHGFWRGPSDTSARKGEALVCTSFVRGGAGAGRG